MTTTQPMIDMDRRNPALCFVDDETLDMVYLMATRDNHVVVIREPYLNGGHSELVGVMSEKEAYAYVGHKQPR